MKEVLLVNENQTKGYDENMQYFDIFVSLFGKENKIIIKVLFPQNILFYMVVIMYYCCYVHCNNCFKSPTGYQIYYELYNKVLTKFG
jgi:hypothetical protein